MELKKRNFILIIIIFISIIVTKHLLEPTQQDDKNSIRPTFNMIFLLIICFLTTVPFCIICIFRNRKPKENNQNNRCIICGEKNKELNDISMCLKCSSLVLVDDNLGFAC